eukprot:TRINITY_DN17301_c1_g1_i2.p1 TRINITY_DN17301_c1_g1~~TRINITY_DN17301_c1_g1_i2.p1  ORF type:complete len:322 (+),score=53.02 TRINITY_DN17301_c1_g1_i2:44-967(+)
MLSVFSVAVVASSAVWPNLCVDSGNAYNSTRCDAEGTCCSSPFSGSLQGCCPLPNAVCCPNNKYTCCPEGSTCETRTGTGFRQVSDCFKDGKNLTMADSVCKPGPQLEPSQTLKNVVVLGDSVSIGYTPVLAQHISDIALVQHTPWGGDGGAEETAYGLKCLKYFLHSPSGVPISPDVLMFNFGLHDGPLGNSTTPGQQGNTSVYPGQLSQIADAIKEALPSTKIVFALTTPMVCNLDSDYNVQYLNKRATEIMTDRNIEVVDFHTPIANECGPIPQASCFNQTNCFCPHCPGVGYNWLVILRLSLL